VEEEITNNNKHETTEKDWTDKKAVAMHAMEVCDES
jgi:hypothetical protein